MELITIIFISTVITFFIGLSIIVYSFFLYKKNKVEKKPENKSIPDSENNTKFSIPQPIKPKDERFVPVKKEIQNTNFR